MSNKLTPVSLNHILAAYEALSWAEVARCTCSSFTIQYEQGCQCSKSKYIKSANSCLQNLLNRAIKERYLG